MSHRKNLRGAITYAEPKSDKYRENYDKIFGSTAEEQHECPEDPLKKGNQEIQKEDLPSVKR